MSVQSEITRIQNNVNSALSAIEAKGVSVPSGATSDDLATLIEEIEEGANLLEVYPVGAIYISYTLVSPASLFGGTWTQIAGKFLIGAPSTVSTWSSASTYAAGAIVRWSSRDFVATKSVPKGTSYRPLDDSKNVRTEYWYEITAGLSGGSANAVAVSHTHSGRFTVDNSSWYMNAYSYGTSGGNTTVMGIDFKGSAGNTITTPSAGVSGSGKNLPPYLAVYMWRRTA